MHDGFVVLHFGTERNAAFQRAGVRAAADRHRLGFSPRIRLVSGKQLAHEFAVLLLHEGRLMAQRLVLHAHFGEFLRDRREGQRRGVADVAYDLQFAPAVLDEVGRKGEITRLVVQFFQPVLVAEQAVQNALHVRALVFKVSEHRFDGVYAEFGRGCVRRFSVGDQLFVSDLEPELPRMCHGEGAGRRLAAVAHHVVALAALEEDEGRVADGEVQADVQNALFGVDDGEPAVRREPDLGHGSRFFVVLDTCPAVFFVAADDEFDRLIGSESLVFERLHGIERAERGTLVVHRAAPPDPSVRDFAAERVARPAVARGNNVEVGEHGERFLAFAEEDFARVIVVIARLESEPFRRVEKVFQAVCRALSEGHILNRVGERGVKTNALGDTCYGLLQKIGHTASPKNFTVIVTYPHFICQTNRRKQRAGARKSRELRKKQHKIDCFFMQKS